MIFIAEEKWEVFAILPEAPERGKPAEPIEISEDQVETTRRTLQKVFDKLDVQTPKFELTEVTLNLALSAEGKLSIIVADAKVAAEAAITLKFTRKI